MLFNFGRIAPRFMIIGVQKGGTSSLYYYLSQHKSILVPESKELHYFDTLKETTKKDYLKNFPSSYFGNKITFDATPRYIYYPGTAEKLYNFNPKLKFIVMLRDPVKRAFSAWNMYKQLSKIESVVENSKKLLEISPREQNFKYLYQNGCPSFEDIIELEFSNEFDAELIEPSLIRRGYYKEQIEEYFKYFPKDSFLFLDFDKFINDTLNSLNKVTNFLGLSDFNFENLNLEPRNKREYDSSLNQELYAKLNKHFIEKNKGLEEMISMKLDWMHL